MADTIAGLRTTIRALAPKKALRRYPPELKDRIRATASRELASGATLWRVARELDLAPQTLERIVAEAPSLSTRSASAIVPVRVIDGARPVPPSVERGPLTVRGPRGIVVEGLDVDGVAALVRALS